MLDCRGELSGDSLEDFLGDESTDHGVDRGKFSSCLEGQLLNSLLIDVSINALGNRNDFCSILRVPWSWEPFVLFSELREGLEASMEGGGTFKFSEICDEELW